MKEWKRNEESVQIEHKKKNTYDKGRNANQGSNNFEINKGSRYNKNPPPMNPSAPASVDIVMGKNQSFQTIMEKKKLKERAAEMNYAAMKANEEASLDEIEKAKRDINFDLNRIAPENLKDIFKEIERFAKDKIEICNALIEAIIGKAW